MSTGALLLIPEEETIQSPLMVEWVKKINARIYNEILKQENE